MMKSIDGFDSVRSGASVELLILTYNHEAYIRECVESAISHLSKDVTIRILDDGSNDETPTILRELGTKYSNLKVEYQANTSDVAGNTMALVSKAQAELVILMSGDDYFVAENQLLARANEAFTHPETQFVLANFVLSKSGKSGYSKSLSSILSSGSAEKVINQHLMRRVSRVFLQGSTFRRDFLTRMQGADDLELSDDFGMVFRIFTQLNEEGGSFQFIEDAVWAYREHESNLHLSTKRQFFMVFETVTKYVPKRHRIFYKWDLPVIRDPIKFREFRIELKRREDNFSTRLLILELLIFNIVNSMKHRKK